MIVSLDGKQKLNEKNDQAIIIYSAMLKEYHL